MIEVVSVASEAYPLIKTGGLADVAGALPAALAPHGVTMRTLLPGYPVGDERARGRAGGRRVRRISSAAPAQLIAGRAGGLDIIVVDAPHLYDRPGNPYVGPDRRDWPDNWKRFAALSYAAYELATALVEGYRPQILHCHDWQAGLAPAYVAFNAPTRVKTIMTVHNIAFQGRFELGHLQRSAPRLPGRARRARSSISAASASSRRGCRRADALTTVSPTYAHEIRTAAYGMGLEGCCRRGPTC